VKLEMPLLLVCNASWAGGTRSRVHVTEHHLTRGAAAAGLSNNPRHSSHPRCAPWSCFTRGPPTLVPRLPRQVAACTAHAVATPRSRSLAGPPPPTFRSSAPPQWKAACSRAVQRLADRCQQACRRSCQAAGREDAAVQLLNRPALQRRRRHGIMVESWASDCPWAAFVKGPHPWKDNVTCLTRRPRPERATSDGRPVSHACGHGETGHRRLASQKPVLTWRFSRSMHVATGRATQSTRHVLP